MRNYLQHGRRHVRGSDEIPCDWHLLDLSAGDWVNVGGTKPPARWCFLPGMDPDTGDPKLELELVITGGTAGSLIANLGITFTFDHPTFYVPDFSGAVHAVTLLANGDLMDGVH